MTSLFCSLGVIEMISLLALLQGEFERLKKYHILTASLVVPFFILGILYLINLRDVSFFFPFFIFLDISPMSILLVGVTCFYEKQEGALKSILISPIEKSSYVFAKIFSVILLNLLSLLILFFLTSIFKELNLSLLSLILSVTLITFFHATVGFLLTYRSKTFTDLLINTIKFTFIFFIPVALEQFNLITHQGLKNLLYLLPTKASLILLNASLEASTWHIVFALLNLMFFSILALRQTIKGFSDFAQKESEV